MSIRKYTRKVKKKKRKEKFIHNLESKVIMVTNCNVCFLVGSWVVGGGAIKALLGKLEYGGI